MQHYPDYSFDELPLERCKDSQEQPLTVTIQLVDRAPQNLTQAQRDYFGAHTYERLDKPGSFHTNGLRSRLSPYKQVRLYPAENWTFLND
ncbi:hypothetical protein [Phormidesmis priestleyi]|uniref:hypothetical protein n=1 Tax=Phormidesmis priestleyi TaxID=268141 RepID=UPI000B303C1A